MVKWGQKMAGVAQPYFLVRGLKQCVLFVKVVRYFVGCANPVSPQGDEIMERYPIAIGVQAIKIKQCIFE